MVKSDFSVIPANQLWFVYSEPDDGPSQACTWGVYADRHGRAYLLVETLDYCGPHPISGCPTRQDWLDKRIAARKGFASSTRFAGIITCELEPDPADMWKRLRKIVIGVAAGIELTQVSRSDTGRTGGRARRRASVARQKIAALVATN